MVHLFDAVNGVIVDNLIIGNAKYNFEWYMSVKLTENVLIILPI